MINQVRTLLLNRSGTDVVPDWVIGEELVPRQFVASAIATEQNIYSSLFGASPDRNFQNYRLAQLMTMLHASELSSFIYALDPRITYLDSDLSGLFNSGNFVPAVKSPGGLPPLIVQGSPASPDSTGQMYYAFTVTVVDGSTLSITQTRPQSKNQFLNYTLSRGLSSTLFPLGNSGYSFFMPQVPTGSTWYVSFNNRPQVDLGQILVNATQLAEATLLKLFGLNPPEPYATFQNLFNASNEVAYKLGGLTLALAYRFNELQGQPRGG